MKFISAILISLSVSTAAFGQDKIDLLVRSEKILIQGDTVQALAAFAETLRLFPQSFSAALRLAEINFARNDYFQAIQFSNVAIDIAENFIESKERSLSILGLPPDSSRQVRQFITDQAHVHHLKATVRQRQNRPIDAEHEFRRALQLNPTSSRILLDLAILLSEQGRYVETKQLLKEAISHNNAAIAPRMNLASLYTNLQETDSALFYFKEVIEIDSTYKWSYMSLANLQTSMQDYGSALGNYSKLLVLDSTSAEGYYRRATTYMELGQYKNAIEDWTQLVILQPKESEHYRNRGLTFFQMSIFDEAITDFSTALELDPQQPYTQINLGYSLYLAGKPKQALQEIEEGLKIVPNYNLGYYFQALVYLQLRKKKKSCQSLNKAIELGLPDSDIDRSLFSKCL